MKMYHSGLDRTVDVPDSTGRALMGSGWVEHKPRPKRKRKRKKAVEDDSDTTTSGTVSGDSN